MSISRRALAGLALVPLSAMLSAWARAKDASAPAEGLHSRVRLLAGGVEESGPARLAGIEIALDPGFKTYWRMPGESGLPPAFDWTGSENLASAEVLWPAPSRSEDSGGVAYGYKDRVLLPIRLLPKDPARAIALELRLDYGACKDICIPASATLRLSVGPERGAARAAIDEALARVPKLQPLGAAGELSILALEPQQAGGKPAILVAARAPRDATLFVEAPEGWYLAAGAIEPGAPAGGHGRFTVDILERPREAAGALDLRLTLVAGKKAVETAASLDTARLPR